MGRLTYESIGKSLEERDNIVVSRSVAKLPGATVVNSVRAALARARDSRLYGSGGIAIIGGAAVYRAFLAHASRLELTMVDCEPDGDARFPFLDPTEWSGSATERTGTEPTYRFVTLSRS